MALTLEPGDIVVGANLGTTANPDIGIVRIDPATGDRTVISDNSIGSGPSLTYGTSSTAPVLKYLSQQSDGSLLATESVGPSGESRLYRIDAATGDRTLISDTIAFADPNVGQYYGAREYGDSILLSTNVSLVSVDPTTGTISPFEINGQNVAVSTPTGFTSNGNELLVAAASPNPAIVKFDESTGAFSVVSGWGIGTGTTLRTPVDVAVEASGTLLVPDDGKFLYRIDPATGNRTVVSSSTVGTGPVDIGLQIALTASGAVISVGFTDEVISIDPVTGNRTVVSSATHGTGPALGSLTGSVLVVANIPEPSTFALAALGGVATLFLRRWRL